MLSSLGILVILVIRGTQGGEEHLFYQTCNPTVPNKLNIHLVPHTHDDAGWLKTVDQYFYGGSKNHAPFAVLNIIDSFLSELEVDPSRRFTYVESSFLWRWWEEKDERARDRMRKLVHEGRLSLTHGGWVMSDEATPHYTMAIDQMSFGLRFLNDSFGTDKLPNVAWQIDAFGHSGELALEFAEMGFDGLFFGRAELGDLNMRKSNQEMELLWQPDPSLGPEGDLFTGILYNLYHPPEGFCYDGFCNDEPIVDNPRLHGVNVREKVMHFVSVSQGWALAYKTPHLLMPMGGDFNYMVAPAWYNNMDKLIKHGNAMFDNVNILYSTPSCYLKALYDYRTTWPNKTGSDFFPYSSYEGKFWSGYYTSRPSLKLMTAKTNNILQAIKRMAVILRPDQSLADDLFDASRAVGLLQHHDAMSGTEKQHVADDYALYLSEAQEKSSRIMTSFYKKLHDGEFPESIQCPLTNISSCFVTEQHDVFVVAVFNPLSRSASTVVRFPVRNLTYTVYGESGVVPTELFPVPPHIASYPGKKGGATIDLEFQAEFIPPMGYSTFVVRSSSERSDPELSPTYLDNNQVIKVSNDPQDLGVVLNENGIMHSIVINKKVYRLQQNFFMYKHEYTSPFSNDASGAYTFIGGNPELAEVSTLAKIEVRRENNTVEIHQHFKNWLTQIIRLRARSKFVEFEWTVGPIDMRGKTSVEFITRYDTDIESGGKFWTDANGRRWVQRVKRDIPDMGRAVVANNYYPATTAARIKDNKSSLTVIIDRAEGASSMSSGTLELLIHRRTLRDDYKGVIEPLNEHQFFSPLVARGIHRVLFLPSFGEPQNEAVLEHRMKALEVTQGPIVSFGPLPDGFNVQPRTAQPIMRNPLPRNVNILTLEPLTDGRLLLRLEHLFEKWEHSTLSEEVTISLRDLFIFDVREALEMTLDGVKEKSKVHRLKWRDVPDEPYTPVPDSLVITLQPMQIRTFILYI